MPMSAAQEGLASSGRRYQHTLRALRFFRGCTAPFLTCASAKTPGSTWPVPGQRVYEQIPVQGINEEESLTSCVPPRETALYHRPLSQVCCDPRQFQGRGTFWRGMRINVNGNHRVGLISRGAGLLRYVLDQSPFHPVDYNTRCSSTLIFGLKGAYLASRRVLVVGQFAVEAALRRHLAR